MQGNNLAEDREYNNRNFLQSISVGSGGSVYSLGLTYFGNGDVHTASDLNGNWSYAYDDFNRLAQATNSTPSPNQIYQYQYDRFGNRWQQNYTQGQGTGSPVLLSFNGNNRISTPGYFYDAAGNLLMDNLNCYTYDAENRLSSVAPETFPGTDVCGATTMSYRYGPDGRRVAKLQNGQIVKQFYYDAAGQEIAETDGSGVLQRAEIFAGGRHLATWTPASGGTTYFNHADWLGTERARTNSAGVQCETITSLPFGDGQTTQQQNGGCATADASPNHFTGKERDTESGNDYFGARYNASTIGRFMTPDPDNAGAESGDPQTWNAFAYARNNPSTNVDPDGLDCISTSNQSATSVTVTVQSGDCTGMKGTYVNGKIDTNSLKFNGNNVSYLFSNSENGTAGTGIISAPIISGDEVGLYAQALPLAGQMASHEIKNGAITMGLNGLLVGAGRAIWLGMDAFAASRAAASETGAEVVNGVESTGRTAPANLSEQLAMEQVKGSPRMGKPMKLTMKDVCNASHYESLLERDPDALKIFFQERWRETEQAG